MRRVWCRALLTYTGVRGLYGRAEALRYPPSRCVTPSLRRGRPLDYRLSTLDYRLSTVDSRLSTAYPQIPSCRGVHCRLSTRPGFAFVWRPSARTTSPFTITQRMPVES